MELLLAGGRVIHGDPSVAPRLADVLLRDGRIAAIGAPGTLGSAGSGPGDATQVLDLTGCTVLPGLIDLHVHLEYTGEPRSDEIAAADSPQRLVARMIGLAQRHLRAGVTTVRDLGATEPGIFVVRDAIAQGLVEGPRVLAAGLVITPRNGHGHALGAHADTAEEVRSAVQGRVDAGADAIKIIATGGVHTQGSDLMAAQYTEAEIRAGVQTAHAAGLTVGSHASNPRGMANAIRAGVDSIEHGIFLDDETAALMAEYRTTFVPTLAATHLYEPNADHPSIPDYVREKAALTVPAHRENFPRALRAGVMIATGTDAGSTFVGHGLAAVEVEILARFGMPPLEAIAAGTRNAARVVHLEGRIGTVEAGKTADLLIVRGDPSVNVADLHRVAVVIQAGRIVHAEPDAKGGTVRP
jgi:imidazolonepropionase-like amidohydrolase